MKHQQVVVDYVTMFKSCCTCLALALSGYVLLKLIQTCFWLPRHLERNQRRLEELARSLNIDTSDMNTKEGEEALLKELAESFDKKDDIPQIEEKKDI